MSKEYVKLQKEWYAKLKESGFKDIEYTREVDGQTFNRVLFSDSRRMKAEDYLTQEAYWHRARSYYHRGSFDSHLQYGIWEHYCEGRTYREIVKLVGKSLAVVHGEIHKVKRRLHDWDDPAND